MKKFLIWSLIVAGLTSCDMGDQDYPVYVLGPVFEVEPPTAYKTDSISEFTVRYERPTTCHMFNGFYYVPEGSTRTVAVEYVKVDRSDCEAEENPVYEVPLRFKPQHSGTYLFKFWTGANTDGSNNYIEIEAVVPQ